MVKTLRKRPRPDDLVTQQRRSSNRIGRTVYLALVVVFAIGMLNFLYGDFIFLRASGLIVRDKTTVAAQHLARIEAVHVVAGAIINDGDPLLQIQSAEMLERLAELSANNARIAVRIADFRIRTHTNAKLLPIAEKRDRETGNTLERMDWSANKHFLTNARYEEALRARYEARKAFVLLSAESIVLKDEIEALEAARQDAVNALRDLRAFYSKGLITATVNGAVGAEIPSVGDVYKPGQGMLSLYHGTSYVLAYLPRRYLFEIEPGLKVKITNGRLSATGVVDEILPLTDAAPREFQNTFKPTDRNQLARIRIDDKSPFPLHEKVSITSGSIWFWDDLTHYAESGRSK